MADARRTTIILVHGVAVDGSTWRGVFDELSGGTVDIRIVQMPMDGFDSDVAAARLVLDDVPGPVVLVGHSYGGAVITQLGVDPKVEALVYVAALQPDVGESLASLSKRFPPAGEGRTKSYGSDRFTPDPDTVAADLAADLPAETSAFLAASLKPTVSSASTATVSEVAWKTKPSWGIVARQDRTIAPDLERFMYGRAASSITEIDGSHMVLMSQPEAVTEVIRAAVAAIS